MTSIHDLTQLGYPSYPSKAKPGEVAVIARRITGAMLKAAVPVTGTPGNGDSYKIAKLGPNQIVDSVRTVITKADDTAITLAIGLTDGTTTTSDAFEASAALNATGIIWSADARKMFALDGSYLTITPSTLAAMDDALEFIVIAEVIDLTLAGLATPLTAVI